MLCNFNKKFATKNKLQSYLKLDKKGGNNNLIHEDFSSDWTRDNFGPVVIKGDDVFFMSDNRHNALDSRGYGLMPFSNIIGVVVVK
tara:strand:- start:1254 stop:1511 length:258 start_codon:yes stop_codon:yes gene_type:complete